jgi:dipeptidyl aminopeptidase/acylaminoacyl peptidase
MVLGKPVNVTHRAGYDNQPAFTPDGRSVYYTSTREDGQADIYRYDLTARRITRVTATPESEYSPTFVPGGKRFSVVRVERDSSQRLWSFALDGSDPQLVLRTIEPVGYHAWMDPAHVALFVLGRPATLQVAELGTEHVDTLARDIGRSLSAIAPGRVSFVTRTASGFVLDVVDTDPVSHHPRVSALGEIEPGSEFVVWTPRGQAVTAQGSKVYARGSGPADNRWVELADFAPDGVTHITRLAVSPDGRWLALVADDGK